MNYGVNIQQEYQKAKSIFLRWSLAYSGLFTLVLIGDILLISFAGEYYTVNLVISIIITCLFVWASIFFFSNIYGDINNRYRYFKGYESGLKSNEEVEFLKKSDELCYINGLYVYPVYVRYSIGLNKTDKVIFAFDNNIDFEMGDSLTITTYQRILVKAEKHS